ncbi:MAG: antitoxin family protein [Anaerolineae bacterium]|jgi:predicted DNA-binding antitoxin AbrB/MazE fold protein|nr:antitoxin family protein [Anaerolineae bacterium]
MAEVIDAVYEKGVLRPLEPLHLRERQTVRIQVITEDTLNEIENVLTQLVEAGVITPPIGYSTAKPVSEQERWELADRLGQAPGKPLSEIIIEGRGAW